MKILYLYAEVMGYTMATIQELAKRGNEVHVVHWNHKKLTPFKIQALPNVFLYSRSEYTKKQLKELVEDISASIVVVSGWMDKDYLNISRLLRKKGLPVVVGFDDQWFGSTKQLFAQFLGLTGLFLHFYSHAWVSGVYQYEYARKLGFSKKNIIFDLYSADLYLFNKIYNKSKQIKAIHYPHRFLFVGRLESVKGLNILLDAWQLLGKDRRDWDLYLVGNGPLKDHFKSIPGVKIKNFMQPEQLAKEAINAGCFVFPSLNEPWGVVVHEFAASGLPLLVSNEVGAASTLLIPGLNGFNFNANNTKALVNGMSKIISLTNKELSVMAMHSHILAQRITPETSAKNLLSLNYDFTEA
jgi:glycosyltransferase involved in cell wall biosynthesis